MVMRSDTPSESQLARHEPVRYVLCIPRACGLNDVLCQIWQSLQYAKANGRKLMVDTRVSGLADRLSRYMTPAQGWGQEITEISDADYAHLNQLSCRPLEIQGCLDLLPHIFMASVTADPNYIPGKHARWQTILRLCRYIWKPSTELIKLRRLKLLNAIIRMRFSKPDYRCHEPCDRDIIVHHGWGGGEDSMHCLERMRATPWLRDRIQKTLNSLGSNFDAVHIRHFDYRTDYESFIAQLKTQLAGRRVLICSDNPQAIRFAQNTLSLSEVLTLNETLVPLERNQVGDRAAHYQWHLEITERIERNVGAFIDLFAMAHADNLHYCSVSRNGWTGYSGFGRLASRLSVDTTVRDAWLGASGLSARSQE